MKRLLTILLTVLFLKVNTGSNISLTVRNELIMIDTLIDNLTDKRIIRDMRARKQRLLNKYL